MTVLTDVELIERARDGDQAALAELYLRHRAVARRVASTACRHGDADDLVNEAFEKVFAAVRRKAGPTDAFRAYLFVTIRRLAARQSARNRDEPYEEVPEPVAEAANAGDLDPAEREMITWAFSTLPDRWQAVLWQTTVEGLAPREVAAALGMSSNAVSALAYRAREKLRQAYLQAHLQAAPQPRCEPHRSALGAYVRDGLGKRERAVVRQHLDGCRSCQSLLAELDDVNHLLARSVVPLFLVSSVGETVAVAGGAIDAAGAAGSALDLPGVAANLGEVTAKGGRRLLEILPETTHVTRTVGRVAATVAVLAALGSSGYLVLENAPEHSEPKDDVVANAGAEPTSTSQEKAPEELDRLSVRKAEACLPSVPEDTSAGTEPAPATEADANGTVGGEVGIAGVRISAALGLDDTAAEVPTTASRRITQVECDPSTDGGDLVVTIEDTEAAPAPEPSTTQAPALSVETGDVVPDLLPGLVPDIDASLVLEGSDGLHLELETNLNEICDGNEQGDLVCRLDATLNEALTSALADAEVEVGLEGLGGQVLTIQLKEGDLIIDAKILNLLP